MFAITFFAIIFAVIIYYFRKIIKIPKEVENIPYISGLPIAWAMLRSKYHDEIEDEIHKHSKGHCIYLVCMIQIFYSLCTP